MFRMWGKEWKDNRMVQDTVICNETQNSRTKKVLQSLEDICYEFDLQTPIWLNGNVRNSSGSQRPDFIRIILSNT